MKPEIAETMIAVIERELAGKRHVAVGASSPVPAAAALLAKTRNPSLRVSILGSEADNPFTDGGRELFDCAAQGRIDCFFFSGVQIDAFGNVNLLGLGKASDIEKRFIGNFGAPYLSGLVPHVISFRTDHSRKSLVEKVDFVSAPGTNVRLLVTNRAVFRRDHQRFRLVSRHEHERLEAIRGDTGFAFDADSHLTERLDPELRLRLGQDVLPRMQKLYPGFVEGFLKRAP